MEELKRLLEKHCEGIEIIVKFADTMLMGV
jgi:hypothetical protein